MPGPIARLIMISLDLARQLKAAGLVWRANTNDFFTIPDRGMEDRFFVLADLQAQLGIFRGWPVVTFHGTAEWALDYILTSEVVWMPREEQLRSALLALLSNEVNSKIFLSLNNNSCSCSVPWQGEMKQFDAPSAADAYGKALLFLLQNQQST